MIDIDFPHQESKARELLFQDNVVSLDELARMTRRDIENKINEHYIVFEYTEGDYIVIPKEKENELKQLIRIQI